jgi:hypothetical protein
MPAKLYTTLASATFADPSAVGVLRLYLRSIQVLGRATRKSQLKDAPARGTKMPLNCRP